MKTLIVVLIFIAFDVITGICKAAYQGDINSTYLRQGLYHKLTEIFAVLMGTGLEYGARYIDLGINLHLTNIIATYICTMELISIIENICEINPGLAKLFKPYLEKLKGDKKDDE